ncbi:hypothetical protein SAY87_021080 [Trapa incisa]|uniref:Major facilitator superfamily domain-containing protein n=1 Tax=Trapa incisa TaxID=236973 RepID=A0AAN7PP20_9MYRT|nr:hypothetical protein SAY87_021080 [Trapa incisa]
MAASTHDGPTSIGKVIAASADVHRSGQQMERARDVYRDCAAVEEKPSKAEVFGWHLYGFCTYFIQTTLIPVLFPLIISQTISDVPEPPQGWNRSFKGLPCSQKEMRLYQALIHSSLKVGSGISPLGWTSISWLVGLILSAPLLSFVSVHLDHGHAQQLMAGAATLAGALFCLPTGFFRTPWIFPLYIAPIVTAIGIASSFHTRNLALMIRGFCGPILHKHQFQTRRSISGWLSLYAAAAGCLGSAIISAFTYHMLEQKEKFISLWVVSIFSGIMWLTGILYVITTYRPGEDCDPPAAHSYVLSVFRYPHAIGSLVSVFLSSFNTMCIFTGAVLYLSGEICLKPVDVLFFWLVYFLVPVLTLPALQPLQQLIRASSVKMMLLGFLLSMVTTGVGFYFRKRDWTKGHVLFLAAIQSTATGILYSFGRVLVVDCAPRGKEGVFATWFSWIRAVGTCAGFAVASSVPKNVSTSFGVAFCIGLIGAVMLVFGNVSDFGGAVAAGNVRDDGEKGSPLDGLDRQIIVKDSVRRDTA